MAMDEGNFLSSNGNASTVNSNHSGNGCTNGTKLSLCTGCQQPIEDRFVMKVNDEPWHETCLQCCVCRENLSRSCFSRDRKLYCRTDYEKLFSTKCSKCQECIHSSELVMRAMGNVYHLNCFVCKVCGRRLEKGEEFAIKNNKLYCKKDYDNSPEQPLIKEENPSVDSASTKENTPADNRKGPKRPRTILTSQQRKVFKSSFEISSKPCRKVREELSRDTGLSVRVVQVWFQNQRAKLKKLARRNNPESADAASCRVNNRSRSGKKDSRKKREPPSPCSSPETMSPGSPTDSLPPGQPPFSACNNMMIPNSHYPPRGMPNHVAPLLPGPPPPYPPHYQQNMTPNGEQFLGVSWSLLHPENEMDPIQSVY